MISDSILVPLSFLSLSIGFLLVLFGILSTIFGRLDSSRRLRMVAIGMGLILIALAEVYLTFFGS